MAPHQMGCKLLYAYEATMNILNILDHPVIGFAIINFVVEDHK